jgi:CRP/FNR family transcriptional regulator, cyclic AMP receptor protein
MARPNPIVDLLSSVELFRGVSKKDLSKIADAMKEMDFAEGKVVTAEGDPDARFYLILEGGARVSIGGRKRQLLGPGQYFGEIALIDGGPRSATITAETPLRTLSLAPWNFKPLLKENPDMTYKILIEVCRLLRSVEKSMLQ